MSEARSFLNVGEFFWCKVMFCTVEVFAKSCLKSKFYHNPERVHIYESDLPYTIHICRLPNGGLRIYLKIKNINKIFSP